MRRRLDEADDLGHQLLEIRVAADQPRLREAVLQVAHERVGIVAEEDGADALVAAATRIEPSEHSPTAKRIAASAPPAR